MAELYDDRDEVYRMERLAKYLAIDVCGEQTVDGYKIWRFVALASGIDACRVLQLRDSKSKKYKGQPEKEILQRHNKVHRGLEIMGNQKGFICEPLVAGRFPNLALRETVRDSIRAAAVIVNERFNLRIPIIAFGQQLPLTWPQVTQKLVEMI